jgi:parvulin-like peptidyl-prolyl isomerase
VRARLTLDAVRQQLKTEQTASDAEMAAYYSTDLDEFTTPARRQIRQIVVRTRARALLVLRRLRDRAAFASMVRRYSRDRNTRVSNGVLTVFQGAGDRAFQRFAFSVRRGALAGPGRFRDGWHLIQALGPVRPARTAPLQEVSGAVREQVLNGKAGAAMARWLDDLKRDHADKVVYAPGFAPGG